MFRQYNKPGGVLSRQRGEPMKQYDTLRVRFWNMLTSLDPDIEFLEGHRADMPSDMSGSGENERNIIHASIRKLRNFAKIPEALIAQHPRIHSNERSTSDSGGALEIMGIRRQ